ncbi:cell cycle and apoptosis regulator protein 2 isoform X2 [Protopterus annectens]|uniref:cell cycle and apoptosis regulator protein 2 isoform X2 n=1 Tax=Protopterus annectens TaxID=7888 RepID=UPI001CFB6671|nr:cell cycle and apoptosis regulator protein 2 isoform X2 [Protopterus annectens]
MSHYGQQKKSQRGGPQQGMRSRSGGSGSSLQGSLLGPGPGFMKPVLDLSHNAQLLQPMSKAPVPLMPSMSMSQKPGILGATPQPLLSSHRLPSLLQMPQKYGLMQAPPQMPSLAMFDRRGRFMDQRGKKGRGNQDRSDSRGLDSMKRKDRLSMQQLPAKRPRRDAPQYRVHFAGYSLEGSVCDAVEVIRRYRSMTLPKEFFDAQLCWVDSFPLLQPLLVNSPCHFHVMDKSETENENEAEFGAPDADPTYTVKVLLLDCPEFEGIARECLQFVDGVQDKKGGPHHPSKLIKFLMGKKDKEVMTLGGAWSPSLDGPNPEEDQSVLIRTAIRCVKELSGVDLSECTQWFRFMEFRYLHQGDPSYVETVVVFLPDMWHCVPSVLDWETLVSEHEASSTADETEENEGDKKEDVKKNQQEKKRASLPKEPSILVYPNRAAMEGKFNCVTLSLHELLEYRKQNVHYSFEVSLLAEQFQEMLQRDSAFSIFKGLLQLPEKEDEKPKEKKTEDGITETDETKAEAQESMNVDEEVDSAETAMKEDSETLTPDKKGQKRETSKRQTKRVDEAGDEADKADSVTAEKGDTDIQTEDVLLLQEEEDEFGAEEEEKKSTASNHSGVESSHQEVEKAPAVILPKDVLVGFAYFDLNFCGYIQRRELEKIILTVGLHLSKEQVSQLVEKVASGISCDYTSLEYDREEYADSSNSDTRLSEDMLMGNIPLLPPSNFSRFGNVTKQEMSTESGDLVSHNGAVVNMKNVLEKLERTEAGRAQVEHKVISLQQKLDEACEQMSAVEQSNKSLNDQLEELRKQIAETEERLKNTEKLKSTYQTQLQHSSRCLTSLMEEMQRIVNKNNRTIDQKSEEASS